VVHAQPESLVEAAVQMAEPETEVETSEPVEVPALLADEDGSELSVDLRIDRIFSSVLDGVETPLVRQSEKNGAGSFVNMFERWIKGLKLLEAE